MAPKLSDLRKMSDDELVQQYDSIAPHAGVGLGFYLDELLRRESARREEQLLDYTKQIRWLTVTVAAAAIIALAISVIALIRP